MKKPKIIHINISIKFKLIGCARLKPITAYNGENIYLSEHIFGSNGMENNTVTIQNKHYI